MRKQERDLLLEINRLCTEGINQGGTEYLQALLKIRGLATEAMRDGRRIRLETIEKINEAAKMRDQGATWEALAQHFSESFAKDLRTRYKQEFKWAVMAEEIYRKRREACAGLGQN